MEMEKAGARRRGCFVFFECGEEGVRCVVVLLLGGVRWWFGGWFVFAQQAERSFLCCWGLLW